MTRSAVCLVDVHERMAEALGRSEPPSSAAAVVIVLVVMRTPMLLLLSMAPPLAVQQSSEGRRENGGALERMVPTLWAASDWNLRCDGNPRGPVAVRSHASQCSTDAPTDSTGSCRP